MGRLIDFADVFLGRLPSKVGGDSQSEALPVLALRDIGPRITPLGDLDRIETGSDGARIANTGDIVLTARGRLRAALVEDQHDGVAVGPNLILLRLKDDIPPRLMLALLRHPEIERRLLVESAGTATPGISIEALRQLEMNLPPKRQWFLAAELVEQVDLYHDEVVEAAGLLKRGVSEWVFDQMTGKNA